MSTFKPHIARPAIIVDTNVGAQTCTIQYSDRLDQRHHTCPMPHPFAGAGWGILTGPTRGTRVMVDTTVGERPFIVATIPMNQFSNDFSDPSLLQNVSASMAAYPRLKSGEIAIQSQSGTFLHFDAAGSAKLTAGQLRFELAADGTGSLAYKSRYENTEAHRSIAGLIKRDLRETPRGVEEFLDKLMPVKAEAPWSTVGRNPLVDTALLTFRIDKNEKASRNPPLVENRSLIYEFARTSMAETHEAETNRISGQSAKESAAILSQPNRRDFSRADVFNLGPHLPNNLIERIEGTAVDIYGNILDINRNIVDFSAVDLKDEHRLEHESALLRRSIKHHFELNARKHPLNIEGNPDELDSHNDEDIACATGHSFSRWSLDIDGEGLTKINIPASSNVGNIPLLARHVNVHDPADRNAGDFRPSSDADQASRRDVQHIAFGNLAGDGIEVPQSYAPPNITDGGDTFAYRTAYHDVAEVAKTLLEEVDEEPAVSDKLNNDLLDQNANAGGRSLHANLDGSLELNVGRDTVDRKSVLLDTAGSIVGHLGADLNGRSFVGQADGDVLLQVGGASVGDDGPALQPAVRFFVKNGDGFHKIEVTGDGIFITSAPDSNIVIHSENNLVLSAKGQILNAATSIFNYGSFGDNGNTINGQRFIQRVSGPIK